MNEPPDRVLIVEHEPDTRALLSEHVMAVRDVEVVAARTGPEALLLCQQSAPDLILLALDLPELSGQDVLVALRAQGYRGPLMVVASPQQPRATLDALRLGASDFLAKPLREAEVMAAVERALATARVSRERDALARTLRDVHRDLEARNAQLAALYEVGQTVTQLRDLKRVTAHVLKAALALSGADHAALYLRDEPSGRLILHAGENLSLSLLDRVGDAVDEPLAALVMTSREPLVVGEEALRRANVARDRFAAAYAPLIVQRTVIGVLAVGNHLTPAPFSAETGQLLAVVAGYAAIAIVSARLSQLLDQRAKSRDAAYAELRARDEARRADLQRLLEQLHEPLVGVEAELIRLAQANGRRSPDCQRDLRVLSQRIRQLITQVHSLAERPR